MKWEYKFAELSALTDECEEQLNELGKEGWEVIKLDWIGETGVVLLKRHKFDWGEFRTECCGLPPLEVTFDKPKVEVGNVPDQL